MSSSPLNAVLRGHSVEKTPIWFMRQAGRYLPEYRAIRSKFPRFTDFLFSTPDIMEVTLQPLNRFDLDAAIIFSDILVIPILLGSEVEVVENYGPQLSQITQAKEVYELRQEINYERCNPIYDSIAGVRAKLDPNKSLIGFAGGPWTVASYMIEGKTSKTFGPTKTFAYTWPGAFQLLLDRICEATAEHLIRQITAGADVIKIFDSWASHVPYSDYDRWITTPHFKIIKKIRETHPEIPVISFTKGAETMYPQYLTKVNANAIALSSSADQVFITQHVPKNIAVQGALDPYLLVAGGQEMVREIQKQFRIFRDTPYIFNLGHGIVPETPIENVELAIKTIRDLQQ